MLKLRKKIVGIDNHKDYYDPQIKEDRLKRYLDHPNYTHFRVNISDNNSLENIFSEFKNIGIKAIVNLCKKNYIIYDLKNVFNSKQVNLRL